MSMANRAGPATPLSLAARRPPPFLLFPKLVGILVRTHPLSALGLTVVTLGNGVIPAFQLWVTRHLLDALATWVGPGARAGATPEAAFAALWPWAAAIAGAMAFGALLELLGAVVETNLREQVGIRLQQAVIEKAQSLDLAFFEHPTFHDLLQRANQDMGGRLVNLMRRLFDVLGAAVTLASFLVILIGAHWALAPIAVIGSAPGFWVMLRMHRKTWWVYRIRTPESRRANYFSQLLTQRENAKEVRLFTLSDHLRGTWLGLAQRLAVERRQLEVTQGWLGWLTQSIGAGSYAACLTILTWLIAGARFTFGQYVMLQQAVQQFSQQIQQVMQAGAGLQEQALYLGDLFEFLSLAEPDRAGAPAAAVSPEGRIGGEADRAGRRGGEAPHRGVQAGSAPEVLPRAAGLTVTFRGVSFAYPDAERAVLRDVDFTLRPGEKIALVGENGAGKSTLVKLMLGLYRPTRGQVLIDGQDLAALDPEAVRRLFAAVFQDFVPYQFPVRENIAFGRLGEAAEADVRRAAALSGAAPFIETLPERYETLLGRPLGGIDLSGGQWQKLAIARALVRDAAVVILDEPTAALDPKAEADVYRQFSEITRGRTTVLISHRLGSARLADRILVLKAGRLIEEGTHEALVRQDGEYGRLFRLQAQWYE